MAEKNGVFKRIPTSKIRANVNALRGVDKDNEKYQLLKESIARHGVMQPIRVSEHKDEETGEIYYGLADGLQRLNASLDLGIKEIDAKVVDENQSEIERSQIILNLVRVETRPHEYSKQLNRMLEQNPTMTFEEMRREIGASDTWLKDRLSLAKLPDNIGKLIDEGKIKASNAKELAKLPEEKWVDFVDRAMTEKYEVFSSDIATELKKIRDSRKKGVKETPEEFKPQPHQRLWAETRDEYLDPQVGPEIINKKKLKTALDGWKAAMAWVAMMDEESQKAQIAKHEARKKELEDAKERKKQEREEAKQRAAAEAKAALTEEQFVPVEA